MKKIILLLIKILLTIFFVLGPINFYYRQTNYYKNINYEIEKMKNIPDNIKLANLGSSHGQLAFYYNDSLNYNTFNFALSSQTPEYDYAILKANIDKFDKDAVLLIPISYFSLYLYDHDLDSDFKSRNDRYYSILKPTEILYYSLYEDLLHRLKFETGRNVLNFKYIINDTKPLLELTKPSGNFPESGWDLDAYRLENVEQLAIDRWTFWTTQRSNLEKSGLGIINPNVIEEYLNIVNLCIENDITPVFITLPVTSYLNNVIPTNFIEKFNKDVQELIYLTDAQYLNFSNDSSFIYDLSLFVDTDHLNKKGAEIITNIVIHELENNELLIP